MQQSAATGGEGETAAAHTSTLPAHCLLVTLCLLILTVLLTLANCWCKITVQVYDRSVAFIYCPKLYYNERQLVSLLAHMCKEMVHAITSDENVSALILSH